MARSARAWLLRGAVCLTVTAPGVGWADAAQSDWVTDPYAPHVTDGSVARLGTAVGFLYGEPLDVVALGVTVAAGQRFGRLTLESEFDHLALEQNGRAITTIGRAERLGVMARLEVLRLGSRWLGGNSMGAIYVEGGAAVAWNHWYEPERGEPARDVPQDSRRVEGQVGFGLLLDHRLQEPTGFPHRVGWLLGWRMALAPGDAGVLTVCRASSCRTTAMPTAQEPDRAVTRSMLFQSSLSFTW